MSLKIRNAPIFHNMNIFIDNIALKTEKRRKFAEILQISAVLFILPIYFFIFVCYYSKVIFKACKPLRKETKMKKFGGTIMKIALGCDQPLLHSVLQVAVQAVILRPQTAVRQQMTAHLSQKARQRATTHCRKSRTQVSSY